LKQPLVVVTRPNVPAALFANASGETIHIDRSLLLVES
jgi:hypothetical protein